MQQALRDAAHGERVVDHQHQRRLRARPTASTAGASAPSAIAARGHARAPLRRTAWPAPPGCRSAPARRRRSSVMPARPGSRASCGPRFLTTTSWLPSTSSTCSAMRCCGAADDHHRLRARLRSLAARAGLQQRAEPEERQACGRRCGRRRSHRPVSISLGVARAHDLDQRRRHGHAAARRSAASPPASPRWSAAAPAGSSCPARPRWRSRCGRPSR